MARPRNTTAAGSADEQRIAKWLERQGWTVEIARVSKGHYDRIAWRKKNGRLERMLIQSKRNGRPEKGYFDRFDPIYKSSPDERYWITHYTTGSRVPKKRERTWVLFYVDSGYESGLEIFEQDITRQMKEGEA